MTLKDTVLVAAGALRRRRRIARAELAIHVLRGRPLIYRVAFHGPLRVTWPATQGLRMAFVEVVPPRADHGAATEGVR